MYCSKKKPLYDCRFCGHNSWCSQGPEYGADIYIDGECSGKEYGWCKHCTYKYSCNGIGKYECEGAGKWCEKCSNYPDWCNGKGWFVAFQGLETKRQRFDAKYSSPRRDANAEDIEYVKALHDHAGGYDW